MFSRSLVQRTTAGAVMALLMACGDSSVTAPYPIPDAPVAPPQFDVVEALIRIKGDGEGDGTTGSNPPSFSLSTLPASVMEDKAWSKSGIPIDTYLFAPSMAVDYGDGTGARGVAVSQSGGPVFHPDGTVTEEPYTYSFRLAHTYADPGTYTITVLAETYADGTSSRTVTKTITVTEDPNLYIENFQIADPVVQLQPAAFSFRARGPGSDPFTVKLSYGTNLTVTSLVAPGGTYSDSFTWAEPGTYDFRAIISNGSRADTLTRAVVVEPAPITITAVDFGQDLFVGDTHGFTIHADGPGSGPYSVAVDFGDGSEAAALEIVPGDSVTAEHTWATSGLFDVQVVVANDFTADTAVVQVPVSRPPPSIDDLEMPDTLGFDEPSEIVFTANDATEGTTLSYGLDLYVEGALAGGLGGFRAVASGETVHLPITAPDYEVEIDLVFILHSLKNGLMVADTAERHLSIVNTVCLAGTFKVGNGCVPAPVGYFVPEDGVEAPEACPVGTYQDQEGQTSCIAAPAGSFVSSPASAEATLCAVGTYQALEGQTGCDLAPAGRYVDVEGASQATPCAAGTYQPAAGSDSCLDAPLGSFVSGVGQTEAQLCPAGTYSDVTGAAACTPASPGWFVSGVGASSAQACAVGSYQALSGQTGCDQAPPGSYVDVTGAARATLCAPGTYQPSEGSTGCLDAPAGSFVAVSGAAAATFCPVGTFQAATGQTSCDPAPVGTYVDVVGASSATSCPVGSSTLATGSTSADACISLGVILMGDIDQAVAGGTLLPAGSGKRGDQQMAGWISDLQRSLDFLEGPQKQAGCVGVRNALAKADGKGSPTDQVTGPARAGIAAALQRILDENGCGR